MSRPIMPPLVALIGRPNVGKSSLFNRLVRARRAIAHDRPGVTRDRLYGEVRQGAQPFRIVDTGGIALDDAGRAVSGPEGQRGFEDHILAQAAIAMEEAQLLILLLDGREGLTPLDEQLARHCRRSRKPLLAVVNKVDSAEHEPAMLAEFHALGLDLVAISASHGYNIGGLVDAIEERLPEEPDVSEQDVVLEEEGLDPEKGLRLAMVGKPNAGKSTLVNRLCGEDRMIVSEQAGTTRDSVDVTVERPDPENPEQSLRITFVDTAGVRRRSHIQDSVEKVSVQSALASARRADVVVLVMDASQGVTAQDKKLIAYLDKEKIPFIAVVNKWDLVPRAEKREAKQFFKDALSLCNYAPLLYLSAKSGAGAEAILPTGLDLFEECGLRVSTGELNRIFREVLSRHQAPIVQGRRAKFYYMTQTATHPPTFVFFVNDPDRVKTSYVRYLENNLRKLFGLRHAPLKVLFRGSHKKE